MRGGAEGRTQEDRFRRRQRRDPALVVQTEDWESGKTPFISLTAGDLAGLSEAMTDLLVHVGVKAKKRVLAYDFNTSLSTLALSRVFTPGLKEGVCEKLGCVAICTDGLSELAARSAYTYGLWQPEVLLIRSNLVSPFRSKLQGNGLLEADPNLETVLVLHNDMEPWPRRIDLGAGEFKRQVLHLVDPALFACLIYPCGGIYFPEKKYKIKLEKTRSGRLSVAPTFTERRRYHLSSLDCERVRAPCECGQEHQLVMEEPAF